MAIIPFYKKSAENLKQSLERFRMENPTFADSKITYAGRLDPMAEGVLVLLTDNDVHQKNNYLGLDKEYEASAILGISTDTYDVLGLISEVSTVDPGTFSTEEIIKAVTSLKHISEQEYPVYSSKTVQGKPLFQWARENRLSEVSIPKTDVTIHDISVIEISYISKENLMDIVESIKSVDGDFRQDEIYESWASSVEEYPFNNFILIRFKTHVSSGTYIRSLADSLGKMLKVPATTMNIRRTKVGDIAITDCA